MQGRASIIGEEVSLEATRKWSRKNLPEINHQQIVVMNPDPEPWEDIVETEPFLDFAPWGERWLSDPGGNPIDFQLVQPESAQMVSRVIFPTSVPAGGCKQILVRDDPVPEKPPTSTDLEVSSGVLANSHLRVELDERGIGGISVRGEKLLGAIGLHLRQDHTDTWTFDTDRFEEPVSATLSGARWVVEEEGPLRGRARLEAQPPVVFDRYEGLDRPPWGNSPPRSLWLASEQRAVADGELPHSE